MMEEAIKLFKGFLYHIKSSPCSIKILLKIFFCELAKKWIRNVPSFLFWFFTYFFSQKTLVDFG